MSKKGSFGREEKNLVPSFFWLHFLFSLVFTLDFNNHGCNGREEEGLILLLGLYMFLYMFMKRVLDIQSLLLY